MVCTADYFQLLIALGKLGPTLSISPDYRLPSVPRMPSKQEIPLGQKEASSQACRDRQNVAETKRNPSPHLHLLMEVRMRDEGLPMLLQTNDAVAKLLVERLSLSPAFLYDSFRNLAYALFTGTRIA